MGSWTSDSNTEDVENSCNMFLRRIQSLQNATYELFLGFTGLPLRVIERV